MAGESNRLIYLFWLDNATLGGQWSPFFFLFFCPVPEDELILGEDDEKKKKGIKRSKKKWRARYWAWIIGAEQQLLLDSAVGREIPRSAALQFYLFSFQAGPGEPLVS